MEAACGGQRRSQGGGTEKKIKQALKMTNQRGAWSLRDAREVVPYGFKMGLGAGQTEEWGGVG